MRRQLLLGGHTSTIDDRLTQIETRLARIEAAVAQTRGPRDAADRRVVHALALVVGQRPFSARQLLDAARHDGDLHAALTDADVVTARDTGRWLARMAGVTIDGLCLSRVDRTRAGALWRCDVRDD
jgi:hypothetical protein